MKALVASALLLTVCTLAAAQAPRAQLDDALRLSSLRQYAAALAEFETVRAQHPDAITSLDGLKMVVVYAETGNMTQFLDLTRWMAQRWNKPTTVTDAERQIKGYIVNKSATDPQLLAHAVEVTRYASEHAAAQGEGDYQGWFDTSRGIALYRSGKYAEAGTWLAKGIDHENLYVRSLAQPFYAMALRAMGDRARAAEMFARARRTADAIPAFGTTEYSVEWTDILITRMVMTEAAAQFGK